jgi:hypothetical protein
MIETLNYIIVSLKISTVALYNNDGKTIKCMYTYLDFDRNTDNIQIIVMTAVSERSHTLFAFSRSLHLKYLCLCSYYRSSRQCTTHSSVTFIHLTAHERVNIHRFLLMINMKKN